MLAAAEANLRQRRTAEADLLRIAAGWADLHPEDWSRPPVDEQGRTRPRLADEEPVRMGGVGTPKVIAHCPAELGLILETTYTGAQHLIADALDLHHRLPKLWATVESGKVAAWKARRVATATRSLTTEQAAQVDESVHAVIATLGWARFELILDATLKRADPETAHAEEEAAATRRFVAVGRALSATSGSDNPHPECSSAAAATAGSGWSPTPAPTPSAADPPPTPSGTPPDDPKINKGRRWRR